MGNTNKKIIKELEKIVPGPWVAKVSQRKKIRPWIVKVSQIEEARREMRHDLDKIIKSEKIKRVIIKYEKIDKRIRILDWKNIKTLEELPKEYLILTKLPYFYQDSSGEFFNVVFKYGCKYCFFDIHRGDILQKEAFQHMISAMKEAGERLHNILKTKRWSDEGEIVI